MAEHEQTSPDPERRNPPQHGEPPMAAVSEEARQVWADYEYFWRQVGKWSGMHDRKEVVLLLMDFGYREREHRREVYGN